MEDARALLYLAESVVDEAEQVFSEGLGASPSKMKNPGDFATEMDMRIENLLRSKLADATSIPVLGEEQGGGYNMDAVWVVDPIDGTSNYAAGNPMCAILVSLVVEDQPILAITSMPMLHRRLCAWEDSPVFCNGEPLEPLFDRMPLVTQIGFSSVQPPAKSPYTAPMRQNLLSELATGSLRPRITGSVGVDLAFAAQGIFDGAISFSPFMWDNAAGAMLVRAAGGVVTDIEGNPWTPRSTGVIAGTPAAHESIMRTIEEILH